MTDAKHERDHLQAAALRALIATLDAKDKDANERAPLGPDYVFDWRTGDHGRNCQTIGPASGVMGVGIAWAAVFTTLEPEDGKE